MNLEIKNFSKSTKHNVATNEFLPDIPFTMACVGCSRSGKSNFLINLLKRKDMLKGKFDEASIFVFSPTIALSEDFDFLKKSYKFDTFNESKIREIISKQQECIQKYGKGNTRHILLIFDDCFDCPSFNVSKSLAELAFRGRHSMISTIMSGQKMSSIPRGVRLNLTFMTVFRPTNLGELQFLSDEFLDKKNRATFVEKMKDVWLVPYNFITFDLLNHDPKMRIREGLVKPMGSEFYLPKQKIKKQGT